MKRAIATAFSALAVLTLVQILGPQLNAQTRWGRDTEPQDGVCFYTDANYRGVNFCVNSNENAPSVGERYNDKISSIRIFGNAEVTVYENSNFGGQRRTISQDTPSLGAWNDRISSFQSASRRQFGRLPGRPSATPAGVNEPSEGVCFYTDANYRGETYCVNGNESAPSLGGLNDRISSIRVFGNADVTVYADSNFGGARQTISQDTPSLGAWNDRISSFQGTTSRQFGRRLGNRIRESRNGACFFTEANFGGESFCVSSGDSQRELEGRFKDRISSIQLFGNAQVIVYEHVSFGGARRTFTRDASNLAGTFNDRISSIEVK